MSRTLALFLATCGAVLLVLGIALAAMPLPQAPLGVYLAIVGLAMALMGAGALRRSWPTSARVRAATEALLTVALLALVLFSAGVLVGRMQLRADLSRDRSNTLSASTRRRLVALERPVHVIAFLMPADPRRGDVTRLLERCRAVSGLFAFEVVDPDARPSLAQELGATRWGLMVAGSGTRTLRVRAMDEAHLSGALGALAGRSPAIAVLSGHGERDMQGLSSADVGRACDLLGTEGFSVRSLDLTREGTVPGDIRACIIPGPRRDLTSDEARSLGEYIDRGGRLLLALETIGARLPHLDELLARCGIDAPPALVLDLAQSAKGDLGTVMATLSPEHPVGQSVGRHGASLPPIVLPGSRPLVPATTAPAQVEIAPIAASSAQSWAATGAPQRMDFDPQRDLKGPLTLAAALTLRAGRPSEARLVVVGGAAWMADAYLDASANRDFLLGIMGWLTSRDVEPLVDLPMARSPLVMTEGEWNLLAAITVLGVPLMWAAAALLCALARR